MKRIRIIGGGASGMMAAIHAKTKENDVVILEKNDRIGKKILVTGNGKCNLGNEHLDAGCYYSRNRDFVESVLKQYDTEATVSFFESIGLKIRSKNGYLYPYSEQASTVLDVLRMELERRGVKIECGVQITECVPSKRGYLLKDQNGKKYEADQVVLACGGPASLKDGGMDGYLMMKNLGLNAYPLVPGLVQLRTAGNDQKGMAGVRCQACIRLFVDREEKAEERGELQLTDYGISGIPVFQLSRIAAYALKDQRQVSVHIDFAPDTSLREIEDFLFKQQKLRGERTTEDLLTGLLNKKLNAVLLRKCQIRGNRPNQSLTREEIRQLAGLLKDYEMMITAVNPFFNAQVCAGGLALEELDEHMQIRRFPGLYMTGELLDADGICGGYNLHWAFATGTIAGKAIRG